MGLLHIDKARNLMRELTDNGVRISELLLALKEAAGPGWYFSHVANYALVRMAKDATGMDFMPGQIAELARRIQEDEALADAYRDTIWRHAEDIAQEALSEAPAIN